MIASWHVLRLEAPTGAVPWRPAGAIYWQAGTSAGDRIAMAGPDCWSFFGVWPDEAAARAAEDGVEAQVGASEAHHIHLRPAGGHTDAVLVGGADPFAGLPASAVVDGPVAVLTLAVVPQDPATLATFFPAAYGPVGSSLDDQPACVFRSNQRAVEMEGLAAFTFTVWTDQRAATAWAYRAGPHRTMLDRSRREHLMDASGFWRFAVLGSRGTLGGADPCAAIATGAAVAD